MTGEGKFYVLILILCWTILIGFVWSLYKTF